MCAFLPLTCKQRCMCAFGKQRELRLFEQSCKVVVESLCLLCVFGDDEESSLKRSKEMRGEYGIERRRDVRDDDLGRGGAKRIDEALGAVERLDDRPKRFEERSQMSS